MNATWTLVSLALNLALLVVVICLAVIIRRLGSRVGELQKLMYWLTQAPLPGEEVEGEPGALGKLTQALLS